MRDIRPVAQLGNRVQEAGKLRMGVKTAKAMKSIENWRFTSPHRDCIDELAALYGGTPKPWSDPKATVKDQFELLSESPTIDVHVPPGGLSTWYEMWAGSGVARRCDGLKVQRPSRNPDEDFEVIDCLCTEEQQMECKPYSRLIVVLANVTFRGVWTLTTKSWNAADELRAMEQLIDSVQHHRDIVRAQLTIEKRSRMTRSGKRNFVVPTLSIPHTMEELASGGAQLAPGSGPAAVAAPATAGELESGEVVEVEIMHSVTDVADELAEVARLQILDQHKLEFAIAQKVSNQASIRIGDLDPDQLNAAMEILDDIASEAILVTGFNEVGRMMVKRPRSK